MSASAPATRPAWVDSELFPFESRFIEVDGSVIHYIDEGSGPLLLLLHGNPTWSFVYRDVIADLRDQFRCVALDYPGFGLSTAAEGYGYRPADHAQLVTSFVDQLGLTEATLVAHDWGGPIGLSVAEHRPEHFINLILANTWAWPVNGQLRAEFASHVMGGLIGRELIRRFNLFVRLLIPAGHRLRKVTSTEMNHYLDALSTRERRNACAILPGAIVGEKTFLTSLNENLPVINELPALILWADADMAFCDGDRKRLEATFPNHHTRIIHGAGHFVQSDAPDQISEAIRTWLTE
ncbi:MAG: alpha/beta fold hydrolase [Tetrasphaera sp.]|nr:alpha/beta fold hydrolase [Tetrasphaera sp.]